MPSAPTAPDWSTVKLVVTEKNIAAEKLASILATGRPKKDKVYSTPVYRFTRDGEDWVAIGLKGHILETEFPTNLIWDAKKKHWQAVTPEGEVVDADIPASLAHPPFPSNRRPFSKEGVNIKDWSVPSLPYLVHAPVLMKPAEREIIRSLKNLAAKADSVVIATDFDREGELIGWDAMQLIRDVAADVPVTRARYSAITPEEIERAFSSLADVDFDLAASGDSRRQIDFIWGAALTRYLSKAKYTSMSSSRPAGRVQTPTLALIVQRERERMAFVPEDYWTIKGAFKAGSTEFSAPHAVSRFKVEAEAQEAMAAVEGATRATVVDVKKKPLTRSAPTPLNTSALQALAASEGISPGRAMRIAESLYMNGLISYPRVDNTVYPPSLDLAHILKELTRVSVYHDHAAMLLKSPLTPTRGKKETTDHPPIHPTGAADSDALRPEEWKLYNMIARRFMATLSDASVAEKTTVTLDVAGQPFTASGEVVVKAGFRAIYPYGARKEELLPALAAEDEVEFLGAELAAKQTAPPARYSQGALIQEMEERGLGTKSTRHAAIERLYEVRYVQNDPVEPTALGMAVISALEEFAPRITTPDMTAELEAEMDLIAQGDSSKEHVVGHSRSLLAKIIDDLVPRKEEFGAIISDAVDADAYIGPCPTCGKDLRLKSSPKTRSSFIGCSGYPDCDVTFPVPANSKVRAVEEPCATCGAPQIQVSAFRSKPRVVCIDPACPTNHEPDVVVGTCKACAEAGREGTLVAQRSNRTLKRFIRCTEYETCGTSYPLPGQGALRATGEDCPSCGAPFVEVTTRRGPWKLCPNMECPSRAEAAEKAAAKSAAKSAAKPAARKSRKPAAATTKKKRSTT